VVLFGPEGVGKTHLLLGLLQALEALHRHSPVAYASAIGVQSEIGNLDKIGLLLVDDLHVFSDDEHQRWLFSTYNDFLRLEKRIVLASRVAPSDLEGFAEDLKSRLQWGLVIELEQPDEAGLEEVLSKLALDRRIALGEDVVRFLLSRIDRSIPSLIQAVNRIDRFSLAGKRPVTIPLAKQALNI
jgi:DnaA regulatory inactivator Hda